PSPWALAPSSMLTSGEPSMMGPEAPQCFVWSFIRANGLPFTYTVGEPFWMVKVFGPQQTAWMPRSSCRAAGLLLMRTSGDPVTIGPTAACGQAGQPCASASTCALSPRRAAAGMHTPNGVQRTTLKLIKRARAPPKACVPLRTRVRGIASRRLRCRRGRAMRPGALVRIALPCILAVVACHAASAQPRPADLVLLHGEVFTVDPHRPRAQALAARGDRIIAVGGDADIQKLAGPGTKVIDLRGRLAIPGFIDGHGHYTALGESKLILDLTHAK